MPNVCKNILTFKMATHIPLNVLNMLNMKTIYYKNVIFSSCLSISRILMWRIVGDYNLLRTYHIYNQLHIFVFPKFQCFTVDGGFSKWQNWSDCSKTCSVGVQMRIRFCNNPVPQYGGQNCTGKFVETRNCTLNETCPPGT